jgi:hypothetical protein
MKEYFACDDCDKGKGINWRSLCCSPECFKEYIRIIDERDNPKAEIEENSINISEVKSSNRKKSVAKNSEEIE